MRLGKKRFLCVEPLEDRCLLSADFVFQWNDLFLEVQQLRTQGNPQSARALAILGAAVYDSVNAISPTHTVYRVDARAFPGASTASADAAAAQAAHDVAYALYPPAPRQPDPYEPLLDAQLGEVADGQAKADGIALGQFVATQMLAWRADDGSTRTVSYQPGTDPATGSRRRRPSPRRPRYRSGRTSRRSRWRAATSSAPARLPR